MANNRFYKHSRFSNNKSNNKSKSKNKTYLNSYQDEYSLGDFLSDVGNQEIKSFFESGLVQAKLNVSRPGDVYEQEADRIARNIVNSDTTKTSKISRVQKRTGTKRSLVNNNTESKIKSLKGRGNPLKKSIREYFEPRFGVDLGNVKVHTDSNANQLANSINAKAFTYGNDIVFGEGQYQPETTRGKELIAHELTHTMQQDVGQSEVVQRDDGETLDNDYFKTDEWEGYNRCGEAPEDHKHTIGNWKFFMDKMGFLWAEADNNATISELISLYCNLALDERIKLEFLSIPNIHMILIDIFLEVTRFRPKGSDWDNPRRNYYDKPVTNLQIGDKFVLDDFIIHYKNFILTLIETSSFITIPEGPIKINVSPSSFGLPISACNHWVLKTIGLMNIALAQRDSDNITREAIQLRKAIYLYQMAKWAAIGGGIQSIASLPPVLAYPMLKGALISSSIKYGLCVIENANNGKACILLLDSQQVDELTLDALFGALTGPLNGMINKAVIDKVASSKLSFLVSVFKEGSVLSKVNYALVGNSYKPLQWPILTQIKKACDSSYRSKFSILIEIISSEEDTQASEIQPKLKVNQSGDIYEQEADKAAERLINNKDNIKLSKVQKNKFSARNSASSKFESKINSAINKGKELPKSLKEYFGQYFGVDFTNIRIHTDAEAAGLAETINAKAFTIGNDIVFGKNEYNPDTNEGKKLIAHELAHTIQQGEDLQRDVIQKSPENSNNDMTLTYKLKVNSNYQVKKNSGKGLEKKVIPAEISKIKKIIKSDLDELQLVIVNPTLKDLKTIQEILPMGLGATSDPEKYKAPDFTFNTVNKGTAKDPKWYAEPKLTVKAYEGDNFSYYAGAGVHSTNLVAEYGSNNNVPVFVKISSEIASLNYKAELEHDDDYRYAFKISLKEAESVLLKHINGKAFGPESTEEQVRKKVLDTIKDNLTYKELGNDKTKWSEKYAMLFQKTSLRDQNGWHSFEVKQNIIVDSSNKENPLTLILEIVKTSSTNIGKVPSKDIIKY